MTTPSFAPTIRTQSELRDAWQHLMGPWDYSGPSVWLMLIHDDRPLPHLTEIAEADEPDPEMLVGLSELLRMLEHQVVPGGRVAFLRSRPGPDVVTPADRQWASGLYAAARGADVACEVIHLATRGSIRPIPPDDVAFVATNA